MRLPCGIDRQARLWDWRAGELACPALKHDDQVFAVAVTKDGRHALTACRDGLLRVWELTTGRLVAAPMQLASATMRLASAPEDVNVCGDRAILVGGGDYFVIDLSRVLADPALADEGLRLLGELGTAQRIEQGDLAGLTSEQWVERWNQFRDSPPPDVSAESLARDLDLAAGAEAKRKITQRAARWEHVLTELILLCPEEPALQAALARRLDARGDREAAVRPRAKAITLYEAHLAKEPRDVDAARELAGLLLEASPTDWTVLKPAALKSAGGATLTLLPDDSVLASGTLSDSDSYTITAPLGLRRLTAIRLEALAHPSLPAKGPGRYAGGHFHLTEVRARHLAGPGHDAPLGLATATADYSPAPHAPPSGAIDGKQDTRWNVWPQVGQDHWIAFQLARPCEVSPGEKLVVELDFRHPQRTKHALGRFRLSVTDRADALLAEQLRLAVGGAELSGLGALAAAYYVQGKFDRTRAILAERVERNPNADATELLLLALACRRLDRPEQARQSYDRALQWLERRPADETVRVLTRQAMIEVAGLNAARADEELGGMADARALAALTAAIQANPKGAAEYVQRGEWYAGRGQWREAANDLAEADRLAPQDHLVACRVASFALYLGEKDSHRLRQQLLARFGASEDPLVVMRLLWFVLLVSDGGEDPQALLEMADRCLVGTEKHFYYPWMVTVKGMAEYRAGHYAKAVDWLHKAGPLVPNAHTRASLHFVLAMAYHRLNRGAEARAEHRQALQYMQEAFGTLEQYQSGRGLWTAWPQCQVLRREAETLLEGKHAEPKP